MYSLFEGLNLKMVCTLPEPARIIQIPPDKHQPCTCVRKSLHGKHCRDFADDMHQEHTRYKSASKYLHPEIVEMGSGLFGVCWYLYTATALVSPRTASPPARARW